MSVKYLDDNRLRIYIFFTMLALSLSAKADWFEDASGSAGINYVGATFGASWGDVNGDGWPDLWTGNHGEHGSPKLYINNGDATFSDMTQIVPYIVDDMHGAAWADIDNDGDQDLLIQVGAKSGNGSGPNQLFLNNGETLSEIATEYGLDYPLGRGRTPLFLDWNNDGRLDILLTNVNRTDGEAPTALFTQTESGFIDSLGQTGMNMNHVGSEFAQMLTVGQNEIPHLLIHGTSPSYPAALFDLSITPYQDSSDLLGIQDSPWIVYDVAVDDFDGNQNHDVFLLRKHNASQLVQSNENTLSAHLKLDSSHEQGFTFRTDGDIQIEISPLWVIKASNIYIGSDQFNPDSTPRSTIFTLNSSDEATHGVPSHVSGEDFGVFIGYETTSGLWHVLLSNNAYLRVDIKVETSETITNLQEIGFVSNDGSNNDRLLIQTDSGFIDQTTTAGLNQPTSCSSVVSADFDNDMDIDLYLVCSGSAVNQTNILYENLGGGTFQLVPNAGGASGTIYGRGESAATADYDGDGYMDIFVTNGAGTNPLNNGPSQLFHNTGKGSHWLEIDLVGTTSNYDAIGARVFLKAGGITQSRLQNGNMHRYSQNYKRIHFGLSNITTVDEITVYWPSGTIQSIYDIDADQTLTVLEQQSGSSGTNADNEGGGGSVSYWILLLLLFSHICRIREFCYKHQTINCIA